MKKKLYEVVSKVMQVPIEEINEESSPETIENWDSLKHMNFILALEEAFDIQLTDVEIVEMVSVKRITEELRRKGVP